MDPTTAELRKAHDALAELYAERLADALARMPIERSLLRLFADCLLTADIGNEVGDIGCGTGRLAPYLAALGLAPSGVDLSPEMVRVARRDHPGVEFQVADLRSLPYPDSSLAGVVCWYSLMYLPPQDRATAFAELFRIVSPGGYLVTAYKAGDNRLRRGGRSVGVEFDIYWLSPAEIERLVGEAGFSPVFWGGRPPEDGEGSAQGYLLARKL